MTSRSTPLRVAFYSHDSYGLGHVRRNLFLARSLLLEQPGAEILLLTGSSRAHSFQAPDRARIVRVAPVTKDASGRYASLEPSVPLSETLRDRKRQLRTELFAFQPDLVVVDHTPLGLDGELLPLLVDLRAKRDVRLVLGLRDIVDEPQRVREAWERDQVHTVLEHLYDDIVVYGDAKVFPLDFLYDLPRAVADKLCYLGYLGRPPLSPAPAPAATDRRPHVLCMVGGGGDGEPLARCFLEAYAQLQSAADATLITGPYLSRNVVHDLDRCHAGRSGLLMLRFTDDLEQRVAEADVVVTMGGYNSIVECVSHGRRTLVVPRKAPRKEQLLRAEAFAAHGMVESLLPDRLSADSLAATVRSLLQSPPPPSPRTLGIDWDGAANFANVVGHRADVDRAKESAPHGRAFRQCS